MKKIAVLILLVSSLAMSQTDSLSTENYEDVLHLREIPRHNLIVDLGIAQPTGDYADIARAGLGLGVEYLYYTNKKLGFGISLRHQYNEFGYLDFQNDATTDVSDNNWTNTSISIGPTYSYTKNRFQFDAFLKGGVAFLNTPDNSVKLSNSFSEAFNSNTGYEKSTSAYLETGIRLNYYFRRSVQVFFSPQFNTTLGTPISYYTQDTIPEIPLLTLIVNDINASNLTFNIGVKIAIGKEYSNGELRVDD